MAHVVINFDPVRVEDFVMIPCKAMMSVNYFAVRRIWFVGEKYGLLVAVDL